MEFRFVNMGSQEWTVARQLRYTLFFEPMKLPVSLMDDEDEECGMHLVAIESGSVIGYGRLNALDDRDYQVSQMVVEPQWQGRGVGRQILNHLADRVRSAGGRTLRLAARTSVIEFYLKAGFQRVGDAFPSQKTGIPHACMMLSLNNSRSCAQREITEIRIHVFLTRYPVTV